MSNDESDRHARLELASYLHELATRIGDGATTEGDKHVAKAIGRARIEAFERSIDGEGGGFRPRCTTILSIREKIRLAPITREVY